MRELSKNFPEGLSYTIGYNPTGIGAGNVTIAGAPTVSFTTTEAVTIDGSGGTDALTHTTPATIRDMAETLLLDRIVAELGKRLDNFL